MFGLFERFTGLVDWLSPSPAQEMAGYAAESRRYAELARHYAGMKNEQVAARIAREEAIGYAAKARGDY